MCSKFQIVLLLINSSHLFILSLLATMSSCLNLIPSQKLPRNIVESLSFIPVESAEHEENLRVKLIVESDIGLLLELDWSSSE